MIHSRQQQMVISLTWYRKEGRLCPQDTVRRNLARGLFSVDVELDSCLEGWVQLWIVHLLWVFSWLD